MYPEAFRLLMYGIIVLSLILIDNTLGNGLMDSFQRLFCNIICFVKRSIREGEKEAIKEEANSITKFFMLVVEVLLLTLTIALLKKFKEKRSGPLQIDLLLQESKEALRQTNEFLEKWRMRRIDWVAHTETPYLDDEPQEITPLKLELPMLHMAIIDTRGSRGHLLDNKQLSRADAGDSASNVDSTLLTVTSLLHDEDKEPDITKSDDKIFEPIEQRSRHLWDVIEEDSNASD